MTDRPWEGSSPLEEPICRPLNTCPPLDAILNAMCTDEEFKVSRGLQVVWPSPRHAPCKDEREPDTMPDLFRVTEVSDTDSERFLQATYDRRGVASRFQLTRGDIIVHQISGVFCVVVQKVEHGQVRLEALVPPFSDHEAALWKKSNEGEGIWFPVGQCWRAGETLPRWLLNLPEIVTHGHPDMLDLLPGMRANNRQGWAEQGYFDSALTDPRAIKEQRRHSENFKEAVASGEFESTIQNLHDNPLEPGEFRETFIPTTKEAKEFLEKRKRAKKEQAKTAARKAKKEKTPEQTAPTVLIKKFRKKPM